MNRQTIIPRIKKLTVLLTAVCIFLIYLTVLRLSPWEGTSISPDQGTVGHQEEHWVLADDSGILEDPAVIPQFRKLESGKTYTMTTRLTYDGSLDKNAYGFLYVNHMFCRILYEDQVIFSYMPEDLEKLDHSKSPGHIHKAFSLPRDCLGKELQVEFVPALDVPMDYELPRLAFGDFLSTATASVVRGMPHNVITILCFLLGSAAVIFSALALKGREYREGTFIGIFALVFSLYAYTECTVNFFFISNPYYVYFLNYTAFSLLPLALMGFIRERMQGRRRIICTVVLWGELLFFLLEMFLHVTGRLDMRELLPVLHGIYFLQMGLIFTLLLTMGRKTRERVLVLQLLPILVGMIIDGLIFWLHLGIGYNDATVTMHGVLIFLITEVVHVWRASIEIYSEYARSKLYRQMAYVDELTGAGNRRAFDEEIQRIISGEKSYESMIVASVDINDLKWVNDHLGHPAGDDLIRSAAGIILKTIGDRGLLFRTGGDEFAVFLYEVPLSDYETMVRQVMEQAAAYDCSHGFHMSMAEGHVQISDNRILEAVQASDKMMYADKERRKSGRRRCCETLFQCSG